MKARYLHVLLLTIFAVGLEGCRQSGIDIDPTLTTYSKEDLIRGPIRLPANFSTNNFRKLTMGVAFTDVGVKAGDISSDIVQTLSTRMQTEMAKLRRFTIFSAHNRGGVYFFQELADVGDANMSNAEAVQMPSLDLILTGTITVSKERQERYNHDLLIYEVECDFSCEDLKTKTVRFAEKAKGRATRSQALSLSGRQVGGFSAASQEEEKQAIYNAAMQALAVMANKLGNTFPVGGKVTSVLPSGSRFSIDKGFEDGLGEKQQMVLFVDYSGVKLPLALAEAAPASNETSSLVYRWNSGDRDARHVIADIKSGKWQNHQLFAVGYGMPIPPEWENAYKK